MPDDETTQAEETAAVVEETPPEEQRVPYERFQQANTKAKEAAERAKALEKQVATLNATIEEREQAGMPEVEQLRKKLEQAEQRASDAADRAATAEQQFTRSTRERLAVAAASKLAFDDPSDVLRFPEFVDLDAIETADEAERAVKRLAKARPKLLKDEDKPLPGRVLENGQPALKDDKSGLAKSKDEIARSLGDELMQGLLGRK